eukprot:8791265-Alexandrium_andersonii.AAC.1
MCGCAGGTTACVDAVVECPHGMSSRAQPALACGVPLHCTAGVMNGMPRVGDRSCLEAHTERKCAGMETRSVSWR